MSWVNIKNKQGKHLPIYIYNKNTKRVRCYSCNKLQNTAVNLLGQNDSSYWCFKCWYDLMSHLKNIQELAVVEAL